MKTENFLFEKYGPLLSLQQLAEILDRSVDGLRISLAQKNNELSLRFGPARQKIGRRVYFRTALVAPILDGQK